MARSISTAQETRILDLLKAGWSNADIAIECDVHECTVASRRYANLGLLKSLKPKSRAQFRLLVKQAKQLMNVSHNCPCTSSGR